MTALIEASRDDEITITPCFTKKKKTRTQKRLSPVLHKTRSHIASIKYLKDLSFGILTLDHAVQYATDPIGCSEASSSNKDVSLFHIRPDPLPSGARRKSLDAHF